VINMAANENIFEDEDEDIDTTEETEDIDEGTETNELLVGKFKNVSELEKAYKESERKMYELAQESSNLKNRLSELENSLQPRETVENTATNVNNDSGIWEEAIYDPNKLQQAISQQMYNMKMLESRISSAVKKAVIAKKDDPHYGKVGDLYEAKMMDLEPFFLANPSNEAMINQVAEDVWKQTVGDYYISNSANNMGTSPVQRKQQIQGLGVEKPTVSDEETEIPITGKEVDMLQSFGLDSKARHKVVQRTSKKIEEGGL